MATPSQRRIDFQEIRKFGHQTSAYDIPDLTVLQTESYQKFLQEDVKPKQRENTGLEAVLREIFPIETYDKSIRLEYLYYELEKPRYEPDECRQLRLTYGKPFKVRLRLVKESNSFEEDVYLGDIPIMLGGGEFIINGAERVVVSQLHRSPGIDFVSEMDSDRKTYSCRVIPERGSWIELNLTRKETISAKIDQSSKLPIMMFLRAMSEEYSTNSQLIRAFYPTQTIKVDSGSAVAKIEGKVAVSDIVYPQDSDKAGQIIVETGETIVKAKAETICTSGLKKIEVIEEQKNKLLLNSLAEDKTSSHEEALAKIYIRLRPGNPPQIDKARELFRDKFYDTNRYRLGRVGRFRINRKLNLDIPEDEMTLKPEDIIEAVKYLNRLWGGDRDADVDDIDHLGNRRLRTIDELASEELRKGFLKLRRTVQERLASRGNDEITPRQVINQKSISAAIEYFFGRGELSQVVDQTNPLSMLTHERRLSALGPGGLNRKRAGFDVRDVHSSHYGRICPIETPEGTNIGLISSLSIYAAIDQYGFLVSPYRRVENGRLTDKIDWLRADEEHEKKLAPADIMIISAEKTAKKLSDLEWSTDRFEKALARLETAGIRTVGDYVSIPDVSDSLESPILSDEKLKDPKNLKDLKRIIGYMPETTIGEIRERVLARLGLSEILDTALEDLFKEKELAELDFVNMKTLKDLTGIKSVRDFLIDIRNRELKVLEDRDNPGVSKEKLAEFEAEIKKLHTIKDRVVGALKLQPKLSIEISKLVVFFPVKHFLEKEKIKTIGELVVKTAEELRESSNYGEDELKKNFDLTTASIKKVVDDTMQEIVDRLDKEGLRLGIPLDEAAVGGKKSWTWSVPDPYTDTIIVRYLGDYEPVLVDDVEYIDVSPSQMVGVSAGLIPFLEHDDANRALMGSNMQRQAVPLLISEPALVATGLEGRAAFNSSLLVHARRGGIVSYVDSRRIVIKNDSALKTKKSGKENESDLGDVYEDDFHDEYVLRKFVGLNERTCQNQVPIVKPGERVTAGQIIADGASMHKGELCLGRNVLVAFMAWDGFNFEDAIIISEDLVKKDTYTSIHIEEFDVEIRDTKLGREEFTNDIPNVGEKALRNLDESGIVRVGTYVRPGDILVGKVTPKSKTELTPEEKLLHAIFGRAGEDVKNESLEVPSGVEGIVIGTQKFSCRMSLSEDERKAFDAEVNRIEKEEDAKITALFNPMVEELEKVLGYELRDIEQPKLFRFEHLNIEKDDPKHDVAEKVYKKHWVTIESAVDAKDRKINSMKRGDELRRGVLQMVKVYVAAKRVISVGDKMAGRHGNKGVIAKILPKEDMPYLADGTPVEIMLNPLGVPSRMNVGQILETHLGWAAARMGYQAITPVFDGATEEEINDELEKADLPRHGKVRLYDGRTGDAFDQETTVGYIYMLKLHHLVDDKVHARSTGPYSLITQQPLGGKARFGGQRFGEMEVWALEAYGAAYTLQELLTVKSDDVEGRTKIYESMVKGENTLEAGTPASFDVLTNEIRGLALNMQLEKSGGL